MKRGPKKPAFAYLRRSNSNDSASEARQRAAIKKAAGNMGYYIVDDGFFFDASISGAKELDQRPALQKLFVLLEEGTIKTVFTEAIDRIARSTLCGSVLIRDLAKMEVTVYDSFGKNLTTDESAENRLITDIMLCLASYEREKIVARMLHGRREAKRKLREKARKNNRISTKVEGRKAYGFHPEEKEILKRIKQLRTKGGNKERTWGGIAKALNEAGHKNRSGSDWKMANVRSIGLANGLC